jgi:hypothetical protein
MKVFTVVEPVFKTEPLFVLGCTFADMRAYLKRRFRVTDIGADDGAIGTMLTFTRAPHRVVWTQKLDAGLALHETFHLVTRICADKGIPIRAHDERGDCADETAAYLFEFFARAVLRRLR